MHAIVVTGFPGAGKTSLSKYLSEVTHYEHYEFDKELEKVNFQPEKIATMPKFAIFDAVHFDTARLDMTLKWFVDNNYHIDIIWVNTDKDICRENISKRKRATIDIEPLNVWYDIPLLRRNFNFGFIEIKDLQYVYSQNYFGPLTIMCENFLNEFEN